MKHIQRFRTGLIALVLTSMIGVFASPVVAGTTAGTDATVSFTNSGSLNVYWDNNDVRFLSNGENPEVTTTDYAIATAIYSLVIEDTRADESRSGYAISISGSQFTIEGTNHIIPLEWLAISSITGLPAGTDASTIIGSPLDSAIQILSVRDEADAIDATINVTITLTIPAGAMPGVYTGDIAVDVTPLIT